MAVVKSYEPGEKPTIRGKVVWATCILYEGPTIKDQAAVDENRFPPQPNNMTAWFRAAYRALGKSMHVMLGASDKLEYLVNDGEGSKDGRGCHQNKYSYLLRQNGVVTQRLDIHITSEDHAKSWQRKVQEGHVPKKRADWRGVSHRKPGIKEYKIWVIDNWATLTDEEFEEKFPSWVGKIPVYGIDDPDKFRNMPQPSFDQLG